MAPTPADAVDPLAEFLATGSPEVTDGHDLSPKECLVISDHAARANGAESGDAHYWVQRAIAIALVDIAEAIGDFQYTD